MAYLKYRNRIIENEKDVAKKIEAKFQRQVACIRARREWWRLFPLHKCHSMPMPLHFIQSALSIKLHISIDSTLSRKIQLD